MSDLQKEVDELSEKLAKNHAALKSSAAVVIRWRCDGCNKILDQKEVEGYGDGHCHVVPYYNRNYDDWDPMPCGPVIKESV